MFSSFFVKQEMTEILLTTFLETRDLVSEVDDEMSRSSELKDLLESRRDRAIRLNNITNFTSGGALAMIGSGIQIGGGQAIGNAGNVMEVAAGAVATGIFNVCVEAIEWREAKRRCKSKHAGASFQAANNERPGLSYTCLELSQ